MRMLAGLLFLGPIAFVASCNRVTIAKGAADGCYYAGDKPVFRIAGAEGRVLIPGEVQTFRVTIGADSIGTYASFNPGYFFDKGDSNGVPLTVGTDPDRKPFRLPLKLGNPTRIEMNWTTYGHEEATLGEPC